MQKGGRHLCACPPPSLPEGQIITLPKGQIITYPEGQIITLPEGQFSPA